MKRQRGRGRKPGGGGGHHHNYNNQNPNRAMESSGPEGGKVRGNASAIYERYLQLARDAASSGDRVLSENYMQYADHYFRLVRSMQPAMPVQQPGERFQAESDYDGDEESAPEGDAAEGEASAEAGEQGAEFSQGENNRQFERGDGDFRRGRNRGRRNRFRPEGGEGAAEAREPREDGERPERFDNEQRLERPDRGERPERGPRRERQPRERDAESGPEGFSGGPKPAFLRSE
jgi:hypothetical protein